MKRYKTYTLALLIVTVAALVLSAAMLSLKRTALARTPDPAAPRAAGPAPMFSGPDTAYYTPNPALSQENSDTSGSEESGGYLITIYKGRIGVFQDGRATPVLTGDTQVYLLPQEDIELLKKGIRAQSLSQVRKILEDYD